jgi:hypothetical protein
LYEFTSQLLHDGPAPEHCWKPLQVCTVHERWAPVEPEVQLQEPVVGWHWSWEQA